MEFFYTMICVEEIDDLPKRLSSCLEEVMQAMVNELMWSDMAFI
jgi:hypothetical protein